ncbi:uncharacterized protein ACLA_066580 [Aspergillus clavatus NRRL 1]|uniref:Uncharacterized protein n=1 Tax=Aspergillus clavatus (strain ATCC 1007 / CBS 513.65 / DSM 816 / NCTC 3887 / NRRL 1 / QM 1276 / 107) TaxID=344612 RepID=A1CGE2_ASPCL|nr:uncharacterized protein ACLA_066580 [Aspergillus clavatus NRRL 1]EAW11022.1 hypothetical protein ACLA_066580 [Aspergillus clavatus NRRL 1]
MSVNQVVEGFSLTNRCLLYTSLMLAPAQFLSGIGSNCPSNLGFLAYNYYTQIAWYKAVRDRELHALSLLPVHFNVVYALTYLGGVTSGDIYMGLLQCAGTAGVLALNTCSAWTSWKTNLPEGDGSYQFFFFGWRTLSPGWRKFIMVWQIGDSIIAFSATLWGLSMCISAITLHWERKIKWWYKYAAIPAGALVMMFFAWPLVMWTELIIARNHIESDTDMVAVWLFLAQVVAMIVPSCGGRFRKREGSGHENPELSSFFTAGRMLGGLFRGPKGDQKPDMVSSGA